MLNNKKVNIILSVMVAICLWAYVIGEINPVTEKTMRSVPITFENEDALESNNLAVLSSSDEAVTIVVSGTRTAINEVDESNVTAVVDLADAAKGSNELKIEFRVPDKVEVTDSSLNKVTIVTEDLKTRNVDVEVSYEGSFDDDREPITLNRETDEVTIKGAATLVDSVDYVKATVEQNTVTNKAKTVEAKLSAMDQNDDAVRNIKIDRESIEVECELGMVKTVKLEVPVIDNSDDGMTREIITPETIVIKGISSAVSEISSVTAEVIDISDITRNMTLQIVPVLPEGVQLSEKQRRPVMSVKVTQDGNISKTIYFNEGDIETSGLGEEFSAIFQSTSIAVTVSADKAELDAINKSDIKLSVDLSGLEVGTHQVDITAVCGKRHSGLTLNLEKIRVIIE